MMRALVLIAGLTIAVPVHAQDYTGNVNPSAWVGPTVMQGAINAQARRNGTRARPSAQVRACSGKAAFRRQYGAGNAKVQRLYSLCRRAGL